MVNNILYFIYLYFIIIYIENNIKEIIDLRIIEIITNVTTKTQLGNPEYYAASCSTLANITFKSKLIAIKNKYLISFYFS